jgi:4-hydroxybenzoate polyprenyltransferase
MVYIMDDTAKLAEQTGEETMLDRDIPSMTSGMAANLKGLVRTMRIRQWTKNVAVIPPLVFDGKLFDPHLLVPTVATFILFCLASSSVYVLNDLVDIEKDRQHPSKRRRPLASGQLHPRFAAVAAAILALIAVVGALGLNHWISAIVAFYLVQNVVYSFYLKNVVIIDVMMIALGFLLRVAAGAEAAHVDNFSPWLYVCAALLALFLGFGKRRQEIALLEGEAGNHRASLDHYNLPFLDQIIGLVVTSTLMAYTLYSFEAETALAAGWRMLLTVPFVFYGILRYLYLIHVRKRGGAPDELLLEDRPLLLSIGLWATTVVAVIYL